MEGAGFSLAGEVPITHKSERAPTVRPSKEFEEVELNPLHEEPKEMGAEKVVGEQDADE